MGPSKEGNPLDCLAGQEVAVLPPGTSGMPSFVEDHNNLKGPISEVCGLICEDGTNCLIKEALKVGQADQARLRVLRAALAKRLENEEKRLNLNNL